MGLRGLRFISVAVLVLALIGTAIFLYKRSVHKHSFSDRDEKFTDVYIDMALAREMAGNDLDSLDILYRNIYETHDVDSAWLFNYVSEISFDAEKNKMIWDTILVKLDSLRKNPQPDSG